MSEPDLLAVARAHREHERYHSLLKLEHAVSLRRDANTLKVLADRWFGIAPDAAPAAEGQRAAAQPDLFDGVAVATTGVLFLRDDAEPAELVALTGRLAATGAEYERLSGWLAGHLVEEWPRLNALLTPELAAAAHPRFAALVRTTTAGNAYGVAGRLLTAADGALRGMDLTPAGVLADPAGAAAVLRTVSWLVDLAAGLVAEQAAALGRSDPDWTAFIAEFETASKPAAGATG